MSSYLKISYEPPSKEILHDASPNLAYRMTPFSSSQIFNSSIHSFEVLVNEETRKVYDLKLSLNNISQNFDPGSTIGILPSNDEKVVNELLLRLGLENAADNTYELSISSNTSKKNACIPKHIPVKSTLRSVFTHYVDLNSVPKKIFLKSLLEYVQDDVERKELEDLCSPKNSEDYNKLISSYSTRSLLGILNHFPSCQPPVERLLENLPPLLPRPYSISSSSLNREYLSITFNVDTFKDNQKGICSNFLEKSIEKFEKNKQCLIPIYFRTISNFILPSDDQLPIIMIGTGTGIAPFRGFLEHRYLINSNEDKSFGDTLLFYGCRSKTNYLYKKDIENYLKSGIISKLFVSFSRETKHKIYVQDNITLNGEELCELIENGAILYVCGDFKKVLPEVRKAILSILIKFRDLTNETAEIYVKNLEKNGKYIVDSWN